MPGKPMTLPEVEVEHTLACRLTVDARNELHEMGVLTDPLILEAALAAINKYEQVTVQLRDTMKERDELRKRVVDEPGCHERWCPKYHRVANVDSVECTCGLDALLGKGENDAKHT